MFHNKPEEKYAGELDDHYSATERILCIDDNTEALVRRLMLIESAENEIIVSAPDWSSDDGGKDIMTSLVHAADRDVKIRIVVDGMNGFLKLKKMHLSMR